MLPIKNYIQHPRLLCIALLKRIGRLMSDKLYLQLRFYCEVGHRLNLKHPKTFSEKLQWLKLYDRQPKYTMMVDKVKVKDYVANIIGEGHIIQTLGVWDKPEEIDFDTLPECFVLKTNHSGGSTGIVICRDKASFDRKSAINRLKKSLQSKGFYDFREWPYKNVERKVFAEEFVVPPSGVKDLPDYKWFCFNGEPCYCQVIQDRTTRETIDFFDINWNHQEFVGLNQLVGVNPQITKAIAPPPRPTNLEQQLCIARQLSKGMPFVRIDLYETEKGVFFGEITFYPMSGFGGFTPSEWDYKLGELISFPQDKSLTD